MLYFFNPNSIRIGNAMAIQILYKNQTGELKKNCAQLCAENFGGILLVQSKQSKNLTKFY